MHRPDWPEQMYANSPPSTAGGRQTKPAKACQGTYPAAVNGNRAPSPAGVPGGSQRTGHVTLSPEALFREILFLFPFFSTIWLQLPLIFAVVKSQSSHLAITLPNPQGSVKVINMTLRPKLLIKK